MIINYLKVAYRFFVKSKVFTVINLLGFTLSISFSLLVILWIINDFSFEKSFNDADRIYRVIEVAKQNDIIVKKANTYLPLADELKKNFPFFENATFVKYESTRVLNYQENKIECEPGFIDESFFEVFNFKFKEGNFRNFYTKENGIILSEKVAKKLFGNEKAVGKIIENKYFGMTNLFEVTGVIDIPENSHFSFEVILNVDIIKGWINNLGWKKAENFCTYVKEKENIYISKKQREALANFLSNYKHTTSKLWFQPILDIHLYQDFEYRFDNDLGNIQIVVLNIVLVILLLAISVFNFINLNLSISTSRYKEIAIRKIVGGSRRHIIVQFFTETMLQVTIAIYLGVIFAELIRPIFNNILSISLKIPYHIGFILCLLLVSIVLGLISGSYSALFLSKLSPIRIFSQKNPKSFNSRLVKILSVLQFAITTAVLIIGLFIYDQLNYIQNKDLGIEKENIIVIKTGLWYGMEAFIQELEKNPDVISATRVINSPDDFFWENKNISWDGLNVQNNVTMNFVWVDDGFWDTYNVSLLEGELYTTDFDAYWKEKGPFKVVINETAKKIIGKKNIIGTIIRDMNMEYIIVGVIKDFHFKSLYKKITPLIMQYSPEVIHEIDVRIKPDNKTKTLVFVKETYLKHRPERVFEYIFFDDLLDQKYKNEEKLSKVIFWFLLFSLIIALSGIVGMVVFSAMKRSKEIAIRKVNGARFHNVMLLLGKEYIQNLFFAFIIGSVVATFFMNNWISSFAYHINIELNNYIIPFIIILSLTIIIIILLLNKIIRQNPVDSLRYE